MSKQILIITSVAAERDAVMKGIGAAKGVDVVVSGVGIAAAAAKTATALATKPYDIVINLGIAGGFVGRARVGSLVVANEIIAADLGAESSDRFMSLDELGFGSACIKADQHLVSKVVEGFRNAELSVEMGSVLSVSTVTGTDETAKELSLRIPEATAEAMEGFGVATAAEQIGVPILEIRAISNPVGPRDREAWRIKEALQMLESASSVLMEVLQ